MIDTGLSSPYISECIRSPQKPLLKPTVFNRHSVDCDLLFIIHPKDTSAQDLSFYLDIMGVDLGEGADRVLYSILRAPYYSWFIVLGKLGTSTKILWKGCCICLKYGSVCWRLRRTMVSFATEHTAVSSSQVALEGYKHMVAFCLKEPSLLLKGPFI